MLTRETREARACEWNRHQTLDILRQELSGSRLAYENASGSDGVFREVFNAVISLELEPGSLISERDLMEFVGCSRSALRPAVIRLEELGLLRSLARKGLIVAPLNPMDAASLYEAREAIETRAVRLAAERAKRQHSRTPRRADQFVGAWRRGGWPWQTFMKRDLEFHFTLASVAGNPYLYDALTRLMPLAARLWNWVHAQVNTDSHFRFHHKAIMDAVRAGDPDAAERAIVEHIHRSRDRLTQFLVS